MSLQPGGRDDVYRGTVIVRTVVCPGSRSCLHRDKPVMADHKQAAQSFTPIGQSIHIRPVGARVDAYLSALKRTTDFFVACYAKELD